MRRFLIEVAKKIGIYNQLAKLFPRYRTMYQFYNNFLKSGELFFDIGANVGLISEIALLIGAKVVAVEPQPKCIDILNKKFGKHPNFKLEPVAVSDSLGIAQLHVCENFSPLSTLSSTVVERRKTEKVFTQWHSHIQVKTVTLDSLIEKYGVPSFCKIDVEAYEYFVISGLNYRIPYISIEFRTEELEIAEKSLALLAQMGNFSLNFTKEEAFTLVLDDFTNDLNSFWSALQKLPKDTWGDIIIKYN